MEEPSTKMRELVMAVGGPMEGSENRKGWLRRIADRAGISYRVACAAYYGEQLSRETKNKLQIAAGRYEAETLANRFEHLAQSLGHRDASFHSEDVAALLSAARALRGLDRS